MPKSTFDNYYPDAAQYLPNNRSSLTPKKPGTSQIYFRENYLIDPSVSLTSFSTDNLYTGNANPWPNYLNLVRSPYNGLGVHIR